MSAHPRPRSGVTIIELIIALAIMGIAATAVGLSANAFGRGEANEIGDDGRQLVRDAQRRAIASGLPVLVRVIVPPVSRTSLGDSTAAEQRIESVLARPDGSVIADPALGLDRLTGGRAIHQSGRLP